jgi:hypothetical protein
MRFKKTVKSMFFSIITMSTLLAIWSIWIKIKPNVKVNQQKTRENQIEFQNNCVLQFVKSFTAYYIKCVCPRIWVSIVYVKELRWESLKDFWTTKINYKKINCCLCWENKRVLRHNY